MYLNFDFLPEYFYKELFRQRKKKKKKDFTKQREMTVDNGEIDSLHEIHT